MFIYARVIDNSFDYSCYCVSGYGFVDFENPQAAELAMQALQNQGIQAQMAKVSLSVVCLYECKYEHLSLLLLLTYLCVCFFLKFRIVMFCSFVWIRISVLIVSGLLCKHAYFTVCHVLFPCLPLSYCLSNMYSRCLVAGVCLSCCVLCLFLCFVLFFFKMRFTCSLHAVH